MTLKLAPYKMGSKSARVLARGLGILRVRNTYIPKHRDTIINWGKSQLDSRFPHKIINKPDKVAIASNKLKTYSLLFSKNKDYLPIFCTNIEDAGNLLSENESKIYCRTHLTGHSGSGIVIASTVEELVEAPLYTLATKAKYEYRIHVFNGEVLDVQLKKKRNNWEGTSISGIRNFSNGWIYARDNVSCPDLVINSAIDAVNTLGLDFGAVDIAYNERDVKAYLYEINTAPGLEGTTLQKYINKIKEL